MNLKRKISLLCTGAFSDWIFFYKRYKPAKNPSKKAFRLNRRKIAGNKKISRNGFIIKVGHSIRNKEYNSRKPVRNKKTQRPENCGFAFRKRNKNSPPYSCKIPLSVKSGFILHQINAADKKKSPSRQKYRQGGLSTQQKN